MRISHSFERPKWHWVLLSHALLILSLLPFQANAEIQWRESSLWRSAAVLPKGQHSWSARISGQKVQSKFDDSGALEPLGQPYEQKWQWGDLLSSQQSKVAQEEIRQYMKSNSISENDVAATSGFDIQREEIRFDLSWAYGLTKKWMFGVFVPISQVTTHIHPEVHIANQPAQEMTILSQKQNNVRKMVEGVIQQKLENQGFRNVTEERRQIIWGDVSLLNQYQFVQQESFRWSFQQILKMPTSRNQSLSDFARITRDEGQIDLGVTSLLEHNFGPTLGIFGLGYVNQLPGPVRVPQYNREKDQLENDVEITRDLGDYFWTGLEARYAFSPKWKFDVAYRYFSKGSDSWENGVVDENSRQQAHLARIEASYIFARSYRYEIEKKWTLNLQAQTTLAGVNMDKSTTAGFEIQTYF
ncbi:MAG: hypothetical protein CL676_05715 [Bdellovibrionaceae bacterium]|nr:hypothetical protein [Pseudobdellovibrionaceae bacterium]|tara:strand:- start:153208 stop:154449 length:1242 start_codon:yes stop_codon:yes gene_type:complete